MSLSARYNYFISKQNPRDGLNIRGHGNLALEAQDRMNEYTSQSQVSKCYVYVIQSGNGPVKIGVANDPEYRRNELQTGNPYPLTIRLLIECADSSAAYSVEASLHRCFNDVRLRGEWFDTSAERVVEIIDIASVLARGIVEVERYSLPNNIPYTKDMNARGKVARYLEENPHAVEFSVRQLAAEVGIGKTVAAEVMAEYREGAFSSNGR